METYIVYSWIWLSPTDVNIRLKWVLYVSMLSWTGIQFFYVFTGNANVENEANLSNMFIKVIYVHSLVQITTKWYYHETNPKHRSCSFLERKRQTGITTTYFSHFQTNLCYGLIAWGHSFSAQRNFSLQRRIVRIIGGIPFKADCRDTFFKFKIITSLLLYI